MLNQNNEIQLKLENTDLDHIKKLSISLNKKELEQKTNNKLASYAKTAKIDGFRVGKVPIGFIKKQYGLQIMSDIIEQETNKIFQDFVKNNKDLAIISRPSLVFKEEDDLFKHYELHLEFMPDYPVADLSETSITLPKCQEIDDDDVEGIMLKLREESASYEADEEHAIQLGHKVLIDSSVTVNGQLFEQGCKKDFWCHINGGKDIIPAFEDVIYGMTLGETKVANIDIPADYYMSEIAGKSVEFLVSIKKIEKAIIPSIEQYIDNLNRDHIKTKEDLIVFLKKDMEVKRFTMLKNKTKEVIYKQLAEKYADITIPKSLIEHEIEQMMKQFKLDKIKDNSQIYQILTPLAKQKLSPHLLLQKFAESYSIVAPETESLLIWYQQEYQVPAETSTEDLKKIVTDNIENIKYAYIEHEAINKLIAQANVITKNLTYQELLDF